MSVLIDLRKLREPLVADIKNSVTNFSLQRPSTTVCTVGLAGDGFHGLVALFLDTPEHSAAHVKEFLKNGIGWYGEDEKGRFCNSCADFSHNILESRLPDYPDFYATKDENSFDYITLSGDKERVEVEEGNEGMNRVVFPFLRAVISCLQPFSQLHRSIPFRIGVEMYDSKYEEFWSVEIE